MSVFSNRSGSAFPVTMYIFHSTNIIRELFIVEIDEDVHIVFSILNEQYLYVSVKSVKRVYVSLTST